MRPPFFAFYPADFANDINVEAMSTTQVGAYVLLLCKAWQADPPASLPNDDQILARFARVDAAVWQEIKLGVLIPFRLGSDGRLHSKRLRKEYDAALKRMRTARENGRKGGRPKLLIYKEDTADEKPTGLPGANPEVNRPGKPNESSASPSPSEMERENASHSLPPTKKPPREKKPKPPPKPREPNLLFDAIVEVTGADPSLKRGHIAKVVKALKEADPPYTPADVREFGRRFRELCTWAVRDNRTRPEVGELENHICKVRATGLQIHKPNPDAQRRENLLNMVSQGNMTREEAEFAYGGPLDELGTEAA